MAPGFANVGRVTHSVIDQLQRIQPRVEPNSRVVFLNDVFSGWDVKFIAELTFRDRSVNVWLLPKVPLSRNEVSAMDYIFRFDHGTLVRIKP
jgi:hypothetical protein